MRNFIFGVIAGTVLTTLSGYSAGKDGKLGVDGLRT
jgi:hypothetical protein